jgi:hypothetical protein
MQKRKNNDPVIDWFGRHMTSWYIMCYSKLLFHERLSSYAGTDKIYFQNHLRLLTASGFVYSLRVMSDNERPKTLYRR